MYPSLNFTYSFSSFYFHIQGTEDEIFNPVTGSIVENGFATQLDNNKIHFFGLSANVPIFNRFLSKSTIDKAKIDVRIAEQTLLNQQKELRNKIALIINDINTAEASQSATQIASSSQEEAFDLIRENYRLGNLSSYDFLESKNKYVRAQSEHAQAKYELFFKTKYLEYLLGE
jgi:outer membrane protein